MVLSDTTTARAGLIQKAEDQCGLGATGITSNAILLAQFVGWMNEWNDKVTIWVLKSMNGFDFDDANYSKYPSGTFAGTTNRDYVFGTDQNGVTQKLLKIKNVAISRDGVNYLTADPIDSTELKNSKADVNVDSLIPASKPVYDPKGGGFDIYPKFTAAEVSVGAKVYVEFYREGVKWSVSGTDTQEPGFASAFHPIIYKGASLEYCNLYKPEIAAKLQGDIFGVYYRGRQMQSGFKDDLETFYANRYPQKKRLIPYVESNK